MKKLAAIAVLFLCGAGIAQADSYYHGQPGTTYNNIGSTTIGSDGTSYNNIGNHTYGSDGSSSGSRNLAEFSPSIESYMKLKLAN